MASRTAVYALWYSPRLAKQQQAYERRTMVIATTVALWDALVTVAIPPLTVALLLLGILMLVNGLVALLSNWTILLPAQP